MSEEFEKQRMRLQGVDDLSIDVFRSLRDTMKVNGLEMAKRLGANGGHMGQAWVLRVLDARDGISQREIAEILHVSRPNITAMLQAVEKAGLVVRKTDETDQRLTRVYLTDAGRKIAEEQRAVLAQYVNETIAVMPEEERRELSRLLGNLRAHIEEATRKEADAG